jgi:hypothetical protein
MLVDREDIFEAWECLCRVSNFAREKLDEREKSNIKVAQDNLTKALNLGSIVSHSEGSKKADNLVTTPITIYLVVYDWVDGTTIHDAFMTEEAAQGYIEDVLQDTRRCQIHEIRLWGEK